LRPLEGRRLWFVGIGGAGLSGYAFLAREWGAQVGGWDRSETPYMRQLDGVEIDISPDPRAPEGWEVIVSTAFRDTFAPVLGAASPRTRAEFLSELVSLQRSIVVAGAHGKTTTAAMIAFCLDRAGDDPSFLIGAEVPQLGGNARAGRGWLVVEGDESDRTIASLRPELAVITNIDLDHHSEFASLSEVEALFREWLGQVPQVVRGDELDPFTGELAVAGEHNRRNAAAALTAVEHAGVDPREAADAIREFRGVGRRLERHGEAGGVVLIDSYAHHPAEIAADIAAARDGGRVLVLFQPHLYSRTRHLAHEFGVALASADAVAVTDIYRAREDPVPGVTGKLVVDAVAEARPGVTVAWAPTIEDGARFVARRAQAGDRVLTLGAGDIDRAMPLIREALS
jgi:UDP-N-acetylmuramate--alanine ligase